MQIKFSESDSLEIELLGRGASSYIYDCNLLFTFRSDAKTVEMEVWVDGSEFKAFLNNLEHLNLKLQGDAVLTSESPGELVMEICSVDSVGHLAFKIELGKRKWIGPELCWSKTIDAFPLDAELLGQICREMFHEFSEIKNA